MGVSRYMPRPDEKDLEFHAMVVQLLEFECRESAKKMKDCATRTGSSDPKEWVARCKVEHRAMNACFDASEEHMYERVAQFGHHFCPVEMASFRNCVQAGGKPSECAELFKPILLCAGKRIVASEARSELHPVVKEETKKS
eukprot:Rmarinus@m.18194